MYKKIAEADLDAVIPDLVYYSEGQNKEPQIGLDGDRDVVLDGKEAFELSLDWKIPGCSLLNMDLIKKVGFEDFNMYADEFSLRKFYLAASKIGFCQGTFYYRIDNPDAITKKMKPSLFQKLLKEVKLLELALHNLDSDSFNARFEKTIIQFYSNYQILYHQKFNRLNKRIAKKYLDEAYKYFIGMLVQNNVEVELNNKGLDIKYKLLRSIYPLFILYSKVKARF